MQPEEAQALAIRLIAEFGLAYTFAFERGCRRLGLCRFPTATTPGQILLNAAYVEASDRESVEDTIRHEIAHALAYRNCGHTGHGKPWQEACTITGARPERLAHPSQTVPGPWQARCSGCGELVSRFRPPRKDRIYFCKQCGEVHGRLDYRKAA
jgi:predicted SprT family Zn-dependent metalloprotease